MPIPRMISVATVLVILVACNDSPTAPQPLDSGVISAASAPSTGGPVLDATQSSFSIQQPCVTFTMQIDVDDARHSQTWFYPNGAPERYKLHVNQNVTFTNLTSGEALTNNSNHNIEVRFDENGNLIEQVVNGAPQRISDAGGGKLQYYMIGHQVITVDYDTTPPTVNATFSGHAYSGGVSGPCQALGHPI